MIVYSNRSLLRDIAFYVKPYKWRFFVAVLFRLVSDVSNLYPAYAFASVVTFFSNYTYGTSLRFFWITFWLWVVAVSIKTIGRYVAKVNGFRIAERISLDAQSRTIRHLFLLDIAWHEKENAGNRLKRIQKGGVGLDQIMRMLFNNFIEIGVNLIGMIVILGAVDLYISGSIIVFLIIYTTISIRLLKKAIQASQIVDMHDEELTGLLFQAINNMRSVKVLAMSGTLLHMIGRQIDVLFEKILVRIFRFNTRGIVTETLGQIFRFGGIIVIVFGIINGRYEIGFLVLFYSYFNGIWEAISELSETSQSYIMHKYGIARMQKTLEEPIAIDSDQNKSNFDPRWKKITVRNLSFSYGKNRVLDNMSFEINRGQRVGIVGLSGAGKSTLFKLLLKEHENFDGDILFDDVSIKDIKKNSFFEHVGVVLQDTEVFNFTLKENITIASSQDFDETGFAQSLEISHVLDFLQKLPQGADTMIGEKGIKLSGGERQRLGIARAIYKKPQILLMDEATSHLDLESEEKIKDSLHQFFEKVTAVVIAHRLTTIREMDQILVVEDGRIIESGNFEELYAKQGHFHHLWEKQKL